MPPMHIQTTKIGEEDGAPVCVALVRCRLFVAPLADAGQNPPGTILWWDDDLLGVDERTIAVFAADVDRLTLADNEAGWEPVGPGMGAVAHEITWLTGHVSSSATVCDIYMDDGSVLLTVITPASQQERNLAEVGTAAYTAPGAP